MLDSLLGAILLFFGFQTPPMVKGETTTASMSATVASDSANASATGKLSQAQVKAKERKLLLEKRKEAIASQKEAFLKNIRTKRENAQKIREEKAEAFTAKLEEIKNEEKKTIAQRVEGNLTTINTARTTAMAGHVTTLNEILTRVTEKGAGLEVDTTALITLISTAEKKIAEAQSAVETQAAKTYTITITSGEKNLKADATAVRISLSDDLKAVHEKVKAARESVHTAVKELGKVLGETI